MKRVLQSVLRFAAGQVLDRYQPLIIAVTGSVGKTSTKRAIAAVLSMKFRVRASEKSYNTDIGMSLAILDVESPGRSIRGWFRVVTEVFWELVTHNPDFPDILVLEMGADHPGDIGRLVRLASPKIGVLTAVTPAHTEFFSSLDAVADEKATLFRAVPADGVAIVSRDNIRAYDQRTKTHARVRTFGMHEEADVRGVDVKSTPTGMQFKIRHEGADVPVMLPGCIGTPPVQAALAAAAVGLAKGMNLVEIADGLARYEPPPSRLRVMPGIKQTTLIDDSYNASPATVAAALDVLAEFSMVGRRIAVLGDMLELGAESRDEHRKVGDRVAGMDVQMLVCVGSRAADIIAGGRDAGMSEDRLTHFATAREAGRFVQDKLQTGDVVLVKASQGIRLERVVVELMAEPLRAAELVCRNTPDWLARK